MRFIGNLIWFILGGLLTGLVWFIAGLIMCISIIGIPLGIQAFKLAGLVIWPFGKRIKSKDMGVGRLFGNIIWIILFGWGLAFTHLVLGVCFFITILGIPFGKQHFKLAQMAFLPFGTEIH